MKDKADIPHRIDPILYADQRKTIEGEIPLSSMHRLLNVVLGVDETIAMKMEFSEGPHGFPLVTGEFSTTVKLPCERCLDIVDIPLIGQINTLLLPNGAVFPEISEAIECYEYEASYLKLSELLEEELLLAMPLVPKHVDISLCNQDMIASLATNSIPENVAESQQENPFAILKRK